jgi:hypothetical protein
MASPTRGILLKTALLSSHLSQDFGARDATPGEIASNFGDKVLGNYDTEHIIK